MYHEDQGVDKHVMVNAYNAEEEHFLLTANVVSRSIFRTYATIIGSHVICKVKLNDDDSFTLKDRIATHGNEDSRKEVLQSDCSMCPPIGVRLELSSPSLRRWRIVKSHVK